MAAQYLLFHKKQTSYRGLQISPVFEEDGGFHCKRGFKVILKNPFKIKKREG